MAGHSLAPRARVGLERGAASPILSDNNAPGARHFLWLK